MPYRPPRPPAPERQRPSSDSKRRFIEIDTSAVKQALKPLASKLVHLMGGAPMKFVEVHGANMHYDFYWQTVCDGTECHIRGERWEADEPQGVITITLVGAGKEALRQWVYEQARAAGWAVLPLQ